MRGDGRRFVQWKNARFAPIYFTKILLTRPTVRRNIRPNAANQSHPKPSAGHFT
jgi:hypothetical protein